MPIFICFVMINTVDHYEILQHRQHSGCGYLYSDVFCNLTEMVNQVTRACIRLVFHIIKHYQSFFIYISILIFRCRTIEQENVPSTSRAKIFVYDFADDKSDRGSLIKLKNLEEHLNYHHVLENIVPEAICPHCKKIFHSYIINYAELELQIRILYPLLKFYY